MYEQPPLHGSKLTKATLEAALQKGAVQAVGEATQLLLDELDARANQQEALAALMLASEQWSSDQPGGATAYYQTHGWDPDPGVLLEHDELAEPPPESSRHMEQQHGPAPGEEAAWEEYHQLPPLVRQSQAMEQQVEALRECLKRIGSHPGEFALPPHWGQLEWDIWLAELSALLPDPDAFQAHSLRQHYPAWAALLGDRQRRPSSDVLRMRQQGIKFKWRHPRSPHQQQHPRWWQNLQRIERAIIQVYGAHQLEKFLDAPEPQPIHLPNHRSISSSPEHTAFTREQIGKLDKSGAAKAWPFQRPPKVVLPLGVATNAAGKLRLVLDGGYVNLWAGKSLVGNASRSRMHSKSRMHCRSRMRSRSCMHSRQAGLSQNASYTSKMPGMQGLALMSPRTRLPGTVCAQMVRLTYAQPHPAIHN